MKFPYTLLLTLETHASNFVQTRSKGLGRKLVQIRKNLPTQIEISCNHCG